MIRSILWVPESQSSAWRTLGVFNPSILFLELFTTPVFRIYRKCLTLCMYVCILFSDYMVEKLGIEESRIAELCNLLYKNYGTTMAGLRVCNLFILPSQVSKFVLSCWHKLVVMLISVMNCAGCWLQIWSRRLPWVQQLSHSSPQVFVEFTLVMSDNSRKFYVLI